MIIVGCFQVTYRADSRFLEVLDAGGSDNRIERPNFSVILARAIMDAGKFALASAGCFLLFGMLTGIWKYFHMMTQPEAKAPYYVDICHRTSLQYAFACALLFLLATNSAWSNQVNVYATLVPILFFASAVFTYWLHGVLKDTDNQLEKPHRLGRATLPRGFIKVYMLALIAGEIGGTAVLLVGFLVSV